MLNGFLSNLAEWTGLEPATPGVTGRYSNQLNYHSAVVLSNEPSLRRTPGLSSLSISALQQIWYALGDSNPCSHRERVVS